MNKASTKPSLKPIFFRFVIVAAIYFCFAVYLYQPYFKNFNRIQYLVIINSVLASLGVFILSRRWVSSLAGSFFAGLIYGFGPFMLGLASYHPAAGFLAAMIPWFFFPAAAISNRKWLWLAAPLSALPFFVIVLFFQLLSQYRLFAVPLQTRLQPADLTGLLSVLVSASRNLNLIGFYHVPVTALVIGFVMLFAARRFGVMIIIVVSCILACCRALLNVSPIFWLTIPSLCCSVIIGGGMQGIISAGYADRKWLLVSIALTSALSIITLLFATKFADVFAGFGLGYTKLFTQAAKMYLLASVAAGVVFFIIIAKLRLQLLRLVLIASAFGIDILFSSRFIVDKIF